MEQISVNDSCIGRILGDDIYDSSGRRLLSRGTEITRKTLEILTAREISIIDVADIRREESETPGKPDLSSYPNFFTMWDKNDIPPEIFEMTAHQYSTSKFDIFLPVKKDLNQAELILNVLPMEDVKKKGNLFTLPEVYYHISKTLSSPTSSAADIGKAISKDPSFTTKLLQLANSSLYPSTHRISSITEAVSMIGVDQLAVLSVGIAFTRSFQSTILEASTMQNFWKHSIATGIASKYLAEKEGFKDTEIFFIGGLLHDIGKILEYSAIMDSAYILHSLCYLMKREQQDIEHELLSFDHAQVGAAYIEDNNLPKDLYDIIRHHHKPDRANNPKRTRIVHLADIIVNAMKIGSSGQYYIPTINTKDFSALKADLSVLEDVRKKVNSHTHEMMGILLID